MFNIDKEKIKNALDLLLFSIIIISMIVLMTGCGSEPIKPQTLTVYQYKFVDIDESLLKPCKVSEPPSKETYPNLNFIEKENILANYSISLLRDLKICNSQISKVKETIEKEKALVIQKNKEVKKND